MISLVASTSVGLFLLAMMAQPDSTTAFGGRLKIHLVADSIWDHCELKIVVTGEETGTQEVSCASRLKPLAPIKKPVGGADVVLLRQLLRDSDLFQGQFWGSDLRGFDGPFVTLTVHDREKAAVLVCFKNESFESGARGRLFAWLSDRIETERQLTERR